MDKNIALFRMLGFVVALAISCTLIFSTTFMLGPMLFVVPGLSDRITVSYYCPGAVSTSTEEGPSTRSSSTGSYGHTVEITCTFADGSRKVITNEQVALASVGGMFGLGALIGLCLSVPLLVAPLVLIRRWKARSPAQPSPA